MILEAVRIVRDWLDDATNPSGAGVNAKVALVPRDGGDPAPGVVEFADETRADALAWGRLPSPSVAGRLMVTVEVGRVGGNVDASIMPPVRNGEVPLVLRILRQTDTAASGTRDGLYVARAVLFSLAALNTNTASASRTRNNVALLNLDSITVLPLYHRIDDVDLVAGFVVRCQMRELTPTG